MGDQQKKGHRAAEPILGPDGAILIAPELMSFDGDVPHLVGSRCHACGSLSFPRASVCYKCLALDPETVSLAARGVLYSYSVIHQAPAGWDLPFVLGYVDLQDGIRILTHIHAPIDALVPDMPLKLGYAQVGSNSQGRRSTYVFEPLEKAHA